MGDKCERVRELSETLRPRIPPNQVVTRKFPVMTAGTARTATKEDWTLTLDGAVENPVTLDWNAFRTLPQQDFTAIQHRLQPRLPDDLTAPGQSLDAQADRGEQITW